MAPGFNLTDLATFKHLVDKLSLFFWYLIVCGLTILKEKKVIDKRFIKFIKNKLRSKWQTKFRASQGAIQINVGEGPTKCHVDCFLLF